MVAAAAVVVEEEGAMEAQGVFGPSCMARCTQAVTAQIGHSYTRNYHNAEMPWRLLWLSWREGRRAR